METATRLELTKDMIGEMFMTREGAVVQMIRWSDDVINYPVILSNGVRDAQGRFWCSGADDLGDLIKHLPKSEYPEYYL